MSDRVGFFARDPFEREQMFEITFADGFALFDRAVKNGLREGRLVALVVAEATITIHVDAPRRA